jgi:hypothetical protein
VLDPQAFDPASILEVFAVQRFTMAFQSRRDEERVIPRQRYFAAIRKASVESAGEECICEPGSEYGDQILLSFGYAHRLSKTPPGNIEEFLNDLIAYDSLPPYRLRRERVALAIWPWQAPSCQITYTNRFVSRKNLPLIDY